LSSRLPADTIMISSLLFFLFSFFSFFLLSTPHLFLLPSIFSFLLQAATMEVPSLFSFLLLHFLRQFSGARAIFSGF
jgi:hypothetical protein